MYVKVKKISFDMSSCRLNVSKVTSIRDIKDLIEKKMDVSPNSQKLFFKGKALLDDLTLCDYNILNNNLIQLMVLHQLVDHETVTDAPSKLFKIGDIIDARDVDGHSSTCAWLEGSVIRIAVCTEEEVVAGSDGLTYFVKLDKYPDDKDTKYRVEDIRPRARHTYTVQELEVGMKVFVNHNLKTPDKRGGWFDAKIVKTNPVVVRLFASLPLPRRKISFADEIDCKIIFPEEIMRIEAPVKIADRTEEVDEEMNTPVARKNPFKCGECEDSGSECKHCGCKLCGTKDNPELTLICDGCESGFCMQCLEMKEMPAEDDDWYCSDCKKEEEDAKEEEQMEYLKKSEKENKVTKIKQKGKINKMEKILTEKEKENKRKKSVLDEDVSAVREKVKKRKLTESSEKLVNQ